MNNEELTTMAKIVYTKMPYNLKIKELEDFIDKNYTPKFIADYNKKQLESIHSNVRKNIFGEDIYAEMGH